MTFSPFAIFFIYIIGGTTSLRRSFHGQEVIFLTNLYVADFPIGKFIVTKWSTTLPHADHASFKILDKKNFGAMNWKTSYPTSSKRNETAKGIFNPTSSKKNETAKGIFNVPVNPDGITIINIAVYDKYYKILGSAIYKLTAKIDYTKSYEFFINIPATLLNIIVHIFIGSKLDLNSVKQIIKSPIAPLLGIICQFGLMPLAAFGYSKVFFGNEEMKQLGMFLFSTNPGLGASNLWTFLLGGSLELSVVMTFFNTVVLFGALPIWTWIFSPNMILNESFYIQFGNSAYNIVAVIVPCCCGGLIQMYFPELANIFKKKILLQTLFNLSFSLSFGISNYHHLFKMFTLKIILATFALPTLGYFLGFIFGFLAKRSYKDIIAICIAAGAQSAYLPIIILNRSIGKPMTDFLFVIPFCAMLMTHILLIIALVIRVIKIYPQDEDIIKPFKKSKEGPQFIP